MKRVLLLVEDGTPMEGFFSVEDDWDDELSEVWCESMWERAMWS